MTNKAYTHKKWDDRQKKEALKQLELLIKKIESGKLKVVSCGYWSSGIGSGATFSLNIKDDS